MAFDRDAADLGEPLIDLEITAVRREVGETDRCSVVDQLQRRLFWELNVLDDGRPHVLPPVGTKSSRSRPARK
ncbi:hypothetical protein chiPu_0030821 [Chiloscyllium punctatum]|uniref:Uncharacterized protein n=1 Tax=Chiloscyllium punctatum TaxID=137246 RepID=A0A401TW81_CHIPU|nr:hypothetical protein [Chiloscyllium punctatum]